MWASDLGPSANQAIMHVAGIRRAMFASNEMTDQNKRVTRSCNYNVAPGLAFDEKENYETSTVIEYSPVSCAGVFVTWSIE